MTKRFKFALAFALCTMTLFATTPSWAEPSCVDAPQPDGTVWRTCVGDDGRTYCESCSNGYCSRVSCNS